MNKSLVEQNRPTLNTFVAANAVLVYLVLVGYSPDATVASIIETLLKSAAAMTLFGILTILFGGLFSPVAKSRIVFFSWNHAMPGHKAFTDQVLKDPRIDGDALKKKLGGQFPVEPKQQNEKWYQLYKKHDSSPSITQAHASYLLTTEMTIVSLIMLVVYGIGVAVRPEVAKSAYYVHLWVLLLVQLALTWKAARTYGLSFVANVLALESAK